MAFSVYGFGKKNTKNLLLNFYRNSKLKFVFRFDNENENLFENEKKLNFILKRKSNVPFDGLVNYEKPI